MFLRPLLLVIGCLVAVVALFYAEENWRGKHAWEKYRREREAKGDHFEWSEVVPPPVPDDQNFAATPLFAELFPKRPEHPRWEAAKLPDCSKAAGNWREGHVENLAAWRACFTNDDLLGALTRYEPVLREVNQASHRPSSRFPIRYEDNFQALLPHLSALRGLERVYRLRALAGLELGRSDTALADVQMCLRLADTVKDEPVLISFLVRIAMIDLAAQPVWEGLTAHRWRESQLAALQAEFQKINQFDTYANAMRGERLFTYHTLRRKREHPSEVGLLNLALSGDNSERSWLDRTIASGWIYQNQLSIDRFYSENFLPAVDWEHRRISPQAISRVDHSLETMPTTPYSLLVKLLVPSVITVPKKTAQSQSAVDETAVACALERYRLAHGEIPENLGGLVPQFLSKIPHDVIDGQPLRYRRTAADQFVLYSIGWNERDDGGQIAWTTDKTPRQDLDKGDWVWFSQPQPSASERK